MNAAYYRENLQLQPHPEGGAYRQTYSCRYFLPATALPAQFEGDRPVSTAIYYLLEKGEFSSFHKIRSDECWHFYAGQTLHIHVIEPNGNYYLQKLGNRIEEGESFQLVVPGGAWFAVEPGPLTEYALTGCTVAPGFDFADFELGDKKGLLSKFPQHDIVINRLCK